ncbi:MAG: class II aldolase/adducin family protein [Proteobacteria bacterium]|nr:class II aldolase/adducin family protein [Desulfobacula sp.]MBU4131908.1 class II aldolase/adducin family protein [Pseudomonadota bacterium]
METDIVKKARQQVCDAGRTLLERGLVEGTWGNCSLRIDDTRMAITPSGRRYENLEPEDIVVMNYHTLAVEGSLRPSSEKKLHAQIYKTRREIHAVIHTHQPNASTVAAARRDLPPILDDQAQILGPNVRCADYALPNTKKIVKTTVKALKGRYAALMANHGAVTLGRTMEEAIVAALVLEKACKAFIEAEFLGGAKKISGIEAWVMHKVYLFLYSKKKEKNK